MTTAFVLSGGGSLGAVQVGMLQALSARNVHPDFVIGTSAGALNAAFIAGHGTDAAALEELARIWAGLNRRDVFPLQAGRLAAAAMGRAESLCSEEPLRRLVRTHLAFDRIEDAPLPLHVVTTDFASGKEVLLSHGDSIDAVVASASIPAVFPSVRIDDRDLVDGGIADNAAISQAVALGADIVYVLPTGYACALEAPPSSPLSSALHALTLLIEQRLILEVAYYAEHADIRVIPPLCPLSVSSTDFRYGPILITQARGASERWLQEGGTRRSHPERFLSLHRHASTPLVGPTRQGQIA